MQRDAMNEAITPVGILILIIQGLLTVVCFFIKTTVNDIKRTQDKTLSEVRITNGRVTKLEQKVIDHDRQDDGWHQEDIAKFDRLFDMMNRNEK